MNAAPTLIGGPYVPPEIPPSGVMFCEMRGTVIAKKYTDAPIPWPRVNKTGKHSPVLCGDLIRAVQTESEIAVAYHWGVGVVTVWKWRKALGVGRVTPGTSRELLKSGNKGCLQSEIAAKGREAARQPEALAKMAATKRGKPAHPNTKAVLLAAAKRPKSEKWKAKRRKKTVEPGGRGRKNIDWDKQPLGEIPDTEIAQKLGCTQSAVVHARKKRGIPAAKSNIRKLTPAEWEEQPFGLVSDVDIAKRLKVTVTAVSRQRRIRGIPAFITKRPSRKEFWDSQPLGNKNDYSLAQSLEKSRGNITNQRRYRQIDANKYSQPFTAAFIAKKLSLHRSTVIEAIKPGECDGWREKGIWYTTYDKARKWIKIHFKDGLPPNGRKTWTNQEKMTAIKLRKDGLTVAEIAKRLGKSPSAVKVMLSRLGVKKKD